MKYSFKRTTNTTKTLTGSYNQADHTIDTGDEGVYNIIDELAPFDGLDVKITIAEKSEESLE